MKKKGKKGRGGYRALLAMVLLATTGLGFAAGEQTNQAPVKLIFNYPSDTLTNQSPYNLVSTNGVGDLVTNVVPGLVVTGFNVYHKALITDPFIVITNIPSSALSNAYVFLGMQIPGQHYYTVTAMGSNYWGLIESVPSATVVTPTSVAPVSPQGVVLMLTTNQ